MPTMISVLQILPLSFLPCEGDISRTHFCQYWYLLQNRILIHSIVIAKQLKFRFYNSRSLVYYDPLHFIGLLIKISLLMNFEHWRTFHLNHILGTKPCDDNCSKTFNWLFSCVIKDNNSVFKGNLVDIGRSPCGCWRTHWVIPRVR